MDNMQNDNPVGSPETNLTLKDPNDFNLRHSQNLQEFNLNPNHTDHRFDYANVKINDKYHLIYNKKPTRHVFDFNPVTKKGRGIVGLNYLNKADAADIELVVSAQDPFIKNK